VFDEVLALAEGARILGVARGPRRGPPGLRETLSRACDTLSGCTLFSFWGRQHRRAFNLPGAKVLGISGYRP
jgi:hypothetical protein